MKLHSIILSVACVGCLVVGFCLGMSAGIANYHSSNDRWIKTVGLLQLDLRYAEDKAERLEVERAQLEKRLESAAKQLKEEVEDNSTKAAKVATLTEQKDGWEKETQRLNRLLQDERRYQRELENALAPLQEREIWSPDLRTLVGWPTNPQPVSYERKIKDLQAEVKKVTEAWAAAAAKVTRLGLELEALGRAYLRLRIRGNQRSPFVHHFSAPTPVQLVTPFGGPLGDK